MAVDDCPAARALAKNFWPTRVLAMPAPPGPLHAVAFVAHAHRITGLGLYCKRLQVIICRTTLNPYACSNVQENTSCQPYKVRTVNMQLAIINNVYLVMSAQNCFLETARSLYKNR